MEPTFTTYWLGPLGALRALPMVPVHGSVDVDLALIGATQTTLGGRLVLDIAGHKRTWGMSWQCLTNDEIGAIRAVFLGLPGAIPRLVDPRETNRLSADASSGGSYTRTAAAFAPTAGTVAYAAMTVPAALVDLLAGGISWAVTTAGGTLLADSGSDRRVPLIPGEQVTVTAWAAGAGAAQVGAVPYDAAGVAGAASLGALVTLTGAWQRLTHTWTPGAGAVAGAPALVAAAGSARTVTTTAWQWQASAVTDWTPGLGCPQVLITASSRRLPGVGSGNDLDITVREV
jgi:hypothetical protein